MEMVAEAAVSFAVEKLGEAMINKVAFLRGVEEQVNLLKDELERMYGFLQDASQKQASNNGIRVWISQIRQVAHDVEDVIETFNLKIDTPRRSRWMLENCTCFPSHLKHLNKLGKEIESIRARLKDNFESRTSYDIHDLGHEGKEPRRSNIAVQQRRLLPQQTDKDVVGLDDDIKLLIGEAILTDRPGLSVARITGMGGLGKSTLAREVYNHADVAARFDFRAWVVFSEEFNPKEVIRKLLKQLVGSEDEMKKLSVEKLSVEELKGMLLERLRGRQYVIVLDDVWEQQHWEFLADAFPDEQDKTSRLLVTSRIRNVPRTARYAHELKPLDPKTSWQLLLNKSFIDNTNGKCPPELEDIGREIVGRCGGLPLAITVIGGLLLEQRQSRSGWEKVLKGMNSHLGRSGDRISAVLELSYHELPPRLKSCFLCLAFFEEDATIRAEKLIQVWIAEGLISQEIGKETMEEIARGYLDELINRNIVQVKDVRKDDKVKSCQIHDLLRQLSIKKAEEEIGFKILREGIKSQVLDKSRHWSVYCSTESLSFWKSPNNKHIRSLFIHGCSDIEGTPSLNLKSFTLLRVLDFEGCRLMRLPKTIDEVIGLKYLGLRDNFLNELPSSLGRLKNLQVLDMRGNEFGIKVPNVIWKLYNLRHLYTDYFTIDEPMRLDTLKNLQTLIFRPYDLRNHNWWPKHLMEMTSLRKLEVYINDYDVTDVREFITSLAKLKNLECLKLKMSHEVLILDGLETLHGVTELALSHEMSALPSVDNFPPNLSHLTLFDTQLREDPMPVLEKLPKLLYLNLRTDAYNGNEMVISDDGFPRLRVLLISELFELRKIELVGEGRGMPELKRFEIHSCYELESLPNKLMTLLQGVEIIRCPKLNTKILEDGDNGGK